MAPKNESADRFVALIAKSSFLECERVAAAREAVNGQSETHAIARRLIQLGFLSRWQAEQIVAGRYNVILGKYSVLDELSAGATTRSYLAEQPHVSRRVVLKTLSQQASLDGEAFSQLQAAAGRLAGLDHPNIVHLYDVEQDGDICFLVIEYLEGCNLQKRIDTEGPLEFGMAAKFICQAADGLAYAHKQGISHLAIHPGNLWIDNNGTVKIRNFGLQQLDEGDVGKVEDINYASPEQIRADGEIDGRCDLYSLGCTLFCMLTGKPPFPNRTDDDSLNARLTSSPPGVNEFRPDAPTELVAICSKLMAGLPDDRFDSAGEVVEQLDVWLDATCPATPKLAVAKPLIAKPAVAKPAALHSEAGSTTPAPFQVATAGVVVQRQRSGRRKNKRTFVTAFLVGAIGLVAVIALIIFGNDPAGTTNLRDNQIDQVERLAERAASNNVSKDNIKQPDGAAIDLPDDKGADIEQEQKRANSADKKVVDGEDEKIEPPIRPAEVFEGTESIAASQITIPGTLDPALTSPTQPTVENPRGPLISAPPRSQKINVGIPPGDYGGGQGVFRNVPEAQKYTLIYDLAIPNAAAFNANPIPYMVDNSHQVTQGFSRIAYYIELESGNKATWVYVSMDAFTDDVKKIGVPSRGPNGSFDGPGGSFQQRVANMNVFASKNAGVTTGTGIATGNIEFWSTNYGGGNAAGIPGAKGSKVWDWGDAKVAGGGYGSMQIHNYQARETLFAYNAWGGANGEVGIGNQPTGNPDWTFSDNINTYNVKNLQVLVLASGTVGAAKLPPISDGESQPTEVLEDIAFAASTDVKIDLIGGHVAYRNPMWHPTASAPSEANEKSADGSVADVNDDSLQFRLSPAEPSPAGRHWDIVHHPKPNADGPAIARLTLEKSKVMFNWTADAVEHQLSAHLCNCLLAISSKGTTHVVALREPATASAIEIVREMKGSATKPIMIEYLPDPRAVMVQITRLDGEFPNIEFRPTKDFQATEGECFARYGPPGQKRMLIGFRSTLKSSLQLRATPYFAVDFEPAPIPLTRRSINDVQQRAKQLAPQLVRQLEIAKKSPPQTPRRSDAIERLKRRAAQCKAVPEQIGQLREQFKTYYADGEGKATIHYRVFLKVGDHQVNLLTTEQNED
jgi:serine/threonine-protein kinase